MTTSIAVATDGKTSPVDDTMLRVGVRLEVLWTEDGEENKWWACSIEDYRLRKGERYRALPESSKLSCNYSMM